MAAPIQADETLTIDQPITINGTYEQTPISASERMKIIRKKLEKRNEQMVRKQIENIRLKQELELMKKMQAVFNEQMKAIENIN